MNLFGCKFCDRNPADDTLQCDRKNFDSLLWALVTVFQVNNSVLLLFLLLRFWNIISIFPLSFYIKIITHSKFSILPVCGSLFFFKYRTLWAIFLPEFLSEVIFEKTKIINTIVMSAHGNHRKVTKIINVDILEPAKLAPIATQPDHHHRGQPPTSSQKKFNFINSTISFSDSSPFGYFAE